MLQQNHGPQIKSAYETRLEAAGGCVLPPGEGSWRQIRRQQARIPADQSLGSTSCGSLSVCPSLVSQSTVGHWTRTGTNFSDGFSLPVDQYSETFPYPLAEDETSFAGGWIEPWPQELTPGDLTSTAASRIQIDKKANDCRLVTKGDCSSIKTSSGMPDAGSTSTRAGAKQQFGQRSKSK